jgi:hypothetical protein
MDRYTTRPDRDGFSVYDAWTGEVAVIAMTPQIGLSLEDAAHTADLLNRRTSQSEGTVYQ